MAYDNFDDLSTALQEYMEDDDAEFQGSIDDVINVGENRVTKDLDLALFRRTDSTAATAIGVTTVAKPTIAAPDILLATKELYLTGGGLAGAVYLERRSEEYVNYYNAGATNGVPRYYADVDESAYILGVPPAAIHTVNVRYLSRPPRLSSANQTNWLSDNVPELLFRACLAESEAFLKGDERIPVWKSDYAELLMSTKRDVYPQQNQQFDRVAATSVPQANRSAMQ